MVLTAGSDLDAERFTHAHRTHRLARLVTRPGDQRTMACSGAQIDQAMQHVLPLFFLGLFVQTDDLRPQFVDLETKPRAASLQ